MFTKLFISIKNIHFWIKLLFSFFGKTNKIVCKIINTKKGRNKKQKKQNDKWKTKKQKKQTKKQTKKTNKKKEIIY